MNPRITVLVGMVHRRRPAGAWSRRREAGLTRSLDAWQRSSLGNGASAGHYMRQEAVAWYRHHAGVDVFHSPASGNHALPLARRVFAWLYWSI